MSSKTKTPATKEEGKSALVPKRRFPEFRKETLRDVRIGDVTEECRSRNGHKHTVASVMGVTKADGIVPMEARLIAADIARYKLVQNDWFAYNPMRLNIGSIAQWKGESEILVSPDYVVFKCLPEGESGINPAYLDQFRGTNAWEEFVTEGGDGGVRVRIYYKDIARIRLALPSPPEQQKIAECLSSVDELIAAQARKLDALKTHKKGLMQQLFPREGETQPRLRFPEFQNTGEWETKRVDERGNVLAGKALAVNAPGPLRPYLRTKNVLDGAIDLSDVLTMPMTDAEFSRFEILDGDILLNEGQSLGLVGRASIYRGEFGQRCAMQNALLRFRAFPSTCPEFAAQAFRRCQKDGTFASIATQTTSVAHLGSSRFGALELAWPPTLAEQQRIADCLSSLDDLIAAQTQTLEALKTHKQGLMQQLFPSPSHLEP
jgi:type I restriction enzyme S subunit